jgi:hypothetical protein
MYTWISFEPYEGFGENTRREMLKVQNIIEYPGQQEAEAQS